MITKSRKRITDSCGTNATPWFDWYAWRPVHLIDRRWAWLEWIQKGGYGQSEVPVWVPFNFLTCWCYREKP